MDEQVVGPDLVLTTDREGARAEIRVTGELDAYTAPGLEDQIGRLVTDNSREVVIDLSETTFVDSSGLRVILSAHRRLTDQGGKLLLQAPSEPVTRLLEITGLADHFFTA